MAKGDRDKAIDASGIETESPFGQAVVIPPQDSLDLHPFQPRDIASVVEEYIDQCLQAGYREIRLIHGKGIGVQRGIVRSILSKHPAVLTFRDAPAEAGGWGATIVDLKPDPLKPR
ncbi:MAG: DNA mismatch repair protein MutS [Deltaproteobacteria bacterium]|jgi:dsDNA-specific endonuclease/ATPase MutS2|nr:MAG: DNA mismatch repair protein MutS [Deltaproteobacteria bacterium]